MEFRIVRSLPQMQVHFAQDKFCLATKKLTIFSSTDHGLHWRPTHKTAISPMESWLIHCSLYARLMRRGIHTVIPCSPEDLEGNLITVAYRQISQLSPRQRSSTPLFQLSRGSRPLQRGLCLVDQSHLLFGEYWSNPEREAVNIYQISLETASAEIFYQFKAGAVRHIHVLAHDPYEKKIWLSTGDENTECLVATLDYATRELTIIGQGDQKWRSVSFAFRTDAVYWGTDNHLGNNQLWRYDRLTKTTTAIGDVIGPVYYNSCLPNHIVFGTTMEKGEGQQDGFARLYVVDQDDQVAEVWRLAKDRWNPRLFGYGVFEFARGCVNDHQFWVTAKGLKGGMCSLLCQIED